MSLAMSVFLVFLYEVSAFARRRSDIITCVEPLLSKRRCTAQHLAHRMYEPSERLHARFHSNAKMPDSITLLHITITCTPMAHTPSAATLSRARPSPSTTGSPSPTPPYGTRPTTPAPPAPTDWAPRASYVSGTAQQPSAFASERRRESERGAPS